MLSVDELYQYFCNITDYDDIEHPYLSEETNYMLAFEKWGQELDLNDTEFDLSEEELERLKVEISDYVSIYFLKWSSLKPIGDIR